MSSGAEYLLGAQGSPLLVGCGGVSADVLCVTVPNLQPNHVYVFRVAAITEIGALALSCCVDRVRVCDSLVREKDWRYRKYGAQATRACQGDLAGATRAQQRQSLERMYKHCFGLYG